MEGGGASLNPDTIMEKQMEAKRRQDKEREDFESYIEEMMEEDEEEGTKTMPPTQIVEYHAYYRHNARELAPDAAATTGGSIAALGIAKEAKTMCEWMSENNMLLDVFDDALPEELHDSRMVRVRTLYFMIDILEKSSAAAGNKIDKEESASRNGPGSDGNDIAADEAANTAGYGYAISFFLSFLMQAKRISLLLLDDKHCDTVSLHCTITVIPQ
ncbi:hypothetical protein BAE44_0011400 [Dichanthelium oligosanthes]|uniref:Uncharacterized protein n=1 Tax=Dichanthelium oligosanthes TaxID=888268 RepID=A0A1E5VR38_9POAL|nr:hypothetical protein BAE44_0011400 [Dichanthelium oligosanthes]